MRKRILVVDDDHDLCAKLKAELGEYGTLNVTTVFNGLEAMEALHGSAFDLVVTDIQMPTMDGFSLIAYMSHHYQDIPLIIITAHVSEDVDARLRQHGVTTYLNKPFETEVLCEKIFEILAAADRGYICGISIAPFLQLLEMERKTCTLDVRREQDVGTLYLAYGALFDARTADLSGERAAMLIISWDADVKIEIEEVCRSNTRTINKDLRFLIMESLRKVDEGLEHSDPPVNDWGDEDEIFEVEKDPASPLLLTSIVPQLAQVLEVYLRGLQDIAGYQAAAIINANGDVLVFDSINPELDVEDICSRLKTSSTAMNDSCLCLIRETVVRTVEHIFLIQSTPSDSDYAFNLLVILGEERGEGLAKIRLRRLFPKLMAKLSTSEHRYSIPPT
ncbi:MAG: response regulator [Deltaproteobacteria bacterium]|nr:response regulator [Deltaproteobacteria bacterium]